MRSFLLSKVALPLHTALLFAYLACVQPGPGDVASCLPLAFLAAGLFEITLLFPSARKGEDADGARRRVARGILRDPVFHIGAAAFFFTVFQTLNGPRALVYDRVARAWRYTPGFFRGLPACLDRLLSIQGAFWVLTAAAAVLAVRVGLGRKGRVLLLKAILGVASALGLYGLVSYALATGPESPPAAAFATFSTASEAGAFFFMNACVAFGLLFSELAADASGRHSLRFLLAALLVNLASTLFTLSCVSIAALAAGVGLLVLLALAYFARHAAGELRLTTFATALILAAAVCFLHFVAYPKNRIHGCLDKIRNGPWLTEEEKAEAAVLRRAAWRMFGEHASGGVGTWGYGHDAGMAHYIRDDEWQSLPDPDASHYVCGNDCAQFLAEYGAFGFALLLSPFLLIAASSAARVVQVARRGTGRKAGLAATTAANSERVSFFDVLPLRALAPFVAAAGATAMSFFVPVFRCPLNILAWATFLASASALLPSPRKKPVTP